MGGFTVSRVQYTAIFILVVSSVVIAMMCDVSMELTVSPIGWILLLPFKKSSDGQVASTFDQRSANKKEGDLPRAHEITCQQASNNCNTFCLSIMHNFLWLGKLLCTRLNTTF